MLGDGIYILNNIRDQKLLEADFEDNRTLYYILHVSG